MSEWEDDVEEDYTMEHLVEVNEIWVRDSSYDVSTLGGEEDIDGPIYLVGVIFEDEGGENGGNDDDSDNSFEEIHPSEFVTQDIEIDDTTDTGELEESDIDVLKYSPPPRDSPYITVRMNGNVEPTQEWTLKNYAKFGKITSCLGIHCTIG